MFETLLGLILIVDVIYYFAAERRRIQRERLEADRATGETLIA